MNEDDKTIIKHILDQGYRVVISNLDGKTFSERYEVYQKYRWVELRRVIITEHGEIVGVEG